MASRNETGLSDIVTDICLDAVAVCGTWIADTAPVTFKLGLAPPGFSILHARRPAEPDAPTHGGELACTAADDVVIRPHPLQQIATQSTSFEGQLLNVKFGYEIIVVSNIYRRPSTSKTVFIDEFADLLAAICLLDTAYTFAVIIICLAGSAVHLTTEWPIDSNNWNCSSM